MEMVQNSHHVLVGRWRDVVLNANEAAEGLHAMATVTPLRCSDWAEDKDKDKADRRGQLRTTT